MYYHKTWISAQPNQDSKSGNCSNNRVSLITGLLITGLDWNLKFRFYTLMYAEIKSGYDCLVQDC